MSSHSWKWLVLPVKPATLSFIRFYLRLVSRYKCLSASPRRFMERVFLHYLFAHRNLVKWALLVQYGALFYLTKLDYSYR
jgi:hypothetical protein